MAFSNFTGNSGPGIGMMPTGAPVPFIQDESDPAANLLTNYNEKYKNASPVLFRDEVIEQILSVLIGDKKPNALLLGAAGVGKTAVVEEIARRIATGDPSIPTPLQDKIIYELPIYSILSGSGIVGQLEEKVQAVVDYASDPDNHMILFIDEIHQLCSGSSSYEAIAQILKPAMARGDIRVIGATTLQESKKLKKDPAFNRRFSKVTIDELDQKATLVILQQVRDHLIQHYDRRIAMDDDVLKDIISISDAYTFAGNHRPDTAITLMDRAMGAGFIDLQKKEEEIRKMAKDMNDPGLIQTFLASLPATLDHDSIKKTALSMMMGTAKPPVWDKDRFKKAISVIKGQDEVVDFVTERLDRYARALFPQTKPVSWFFAGTSGTGKTAVAKIVAQQLTGHDPLILNMTEYSDHSTINRLMGSPAGFVGSESNAEKPLDILQSNPYQVILLDEFEKAHPSVQKLFMQALDEARLVTNQNEYLDFSKSIMIFTANAGEKEILDEQPMYLMPVKHHELNAKEQIDVLNKSFDLALINRFEKKLFFKTLSKDTYKDILKETYAREKALVTENHPRINLPDTLSDKQINELCEKTYDARMGARPVLGAIREFIEQNAS